MERALAREPEQDRAEGEGLLREGRNCWRIVRARRATVLVDAAAYYAAFADAVSRARESVLLLAWDVDSRVRLVPGDRVAGLPSDLAHFLDAAVSRSATLNVHLLAWDFNMIYIFEREALPVLKLSWRTHRRFRFRLDGDHPLWASRHQKVAAVDDRVAFAGGLDITNSRWDTPEHRVRDPRRVNPDGRPYGPFHDVQMAVDGDAAAALADLARDRWFRATKERLSPPEPRAPERPGGEGDPWPPGLLPDFEDVVVGISRTEPARNGDPGIREVEQLYLDAFRAARRHIYIENQYLSSHVLGDAMASRLADPDGPEIVMVLPRVPSGGLEEHTMGVLRARLLRRLREADRHGRLRVYYPVPAEEGEDINVHSKVMVVDDRLLRVGSSNLTNRSMGLDTECDLAIESRGEERIETRIAAVRARLLGEHLGLHPGQVEDALREKGSLVGAVESLRGSGRTLLPLGGEVPEWQDRLIPENGIADWERPVDPDELIREYVPEEVQVWTRRRLLRGAIFLSCLIALAVAWRWTPLGGWVSPAAVTGWVREVGESPAAPLAVLGAYVFGSLISVPVSVLIVATAFAFGPVAGFTLSFVGSILGAMATFGVGRLVGAKGVHLLTGPRITRLRRILERRGLPTIIVLRMLPVAPFSVVNVVAGALDIRFSDFLLGTAIGMFPGILAITVFGERLGYAFRHPGWESISVLALLAATIALAVRWMRKRLKGRAPEDREAR